MVDGGENEWLKSGEKIIELINFYLNFLFF